MRRRHPTAKKAKVAGITVRSGFEALVMSKAREHTDMLYEPDKFEYQGKPRKYTPDVKLPNGIYIEIKGRFTAADRAKHRAMREQHPDVDIRFVLQADRLLYTGAKSRYGEWLDKMGIPWAVGEIPLEWIEEKG